MAPDRPFRAPSARGPAGSGTIARTTPGGPPPSVSHATGIRSCQRGTWVLLPPFVGDPRRAPKAPPSQGSFEGAGGSRGGGLLFDTRHYWGFGGRPTPPSGPPEPTPPAPPPPFSVIGPNCSRGLRPIKNILWRLRHLYKTQHHFGGWGGLPPPTHTHTHTHASHLLWLRPILCPFPPLPLAPHHDTGARTHTRAPTSPTTPTKPSSW